MTAAPDSTHTLLDAARAFAAAGVSVVPVANDGTKRPAGRWEQYQHQLATNEDLQRWFAPGVFDGLGVVCGSVSGNLEMLELEGRAIDLGPQLAQVLADNGAADLWTRLSAGYLERSPSGGFHWLYRVVDGPARRNTKLARRPGPDDGQGRPTIEVLIETRGEGGFVVAAPSGGRAHPSGGAWTMIAGGPGSIPSITSDERDLLYAVCSTFDATPAADPAPRPASSSTPGPVASYDGELRPGDDFNVRASWDDVLVPHGWKRTRKNFAGDGSAWTRPGKNQGVSATTGTSSDGVDRLYVFSTSTCFESERPYSKFAALAVLEHGGDLAATAAALRGQGYGGPPPAAVELTITGTPPTASPSQQQPQLRLVHGGQADAPTDGANALALAPARTLERSEDGHAHQLIDAYGSLIRYCPQRGRWLVWDGTVWRWQAADGGSVREFAKEVARTFPAGDQQATAWKRKTLSSAGIAGCLAQARTDRRVTVDLTDLDADPWVLNTPAGIVDLRTGTQRPPDPTALCTKVTRAVPDWDSVDPAWEKFLADTFTDPELLRYVRRLVGLSLIGTVLEQVLPFLHGVGANGKTTLVEAVMHALGVGDGGYAIAANAEMLMIRKHSEHPTELAQLAGARLVVLSELEDGQRFAEARIKQLTGRDSISARFMRQDLFTFRPSHTLWLLGNHRPQARTGGDAFWRRVKLLPFANVVPEEQRDPALGAKLEAAAGVVLAWAIRGAAEYAAQGRLDEPMCVSEATRAYADDQNTVQRFLDDQVHLAPGVDAARVPVADVRGAYERWCTEVGETPVSAKRLTQELREHGVTDTKGAKGRRLYVGLTLYSDPAEDDGEPELGWWQR